MGRGSTDAGSESEDTVVDELDWDEAARRFHEERNWWVHTTGRDGPHAVPVWGVALSGVLTFYGHPDAVRSRNLTADPRLVVTLEDAERPLIVHGTARRAGAAADHPGLGEAYRAKYRRVHDAEYLPDAESAAEALAWQVVPLKALAWEVTSIAAWETRRWHAPASGVGPA